MKIIKLGEIAKIDISNVDKKVKEADSPVILCNFVDVYHNWAITNDLLPNLMKSTANINQISRFSIHKGQVAITKDSETRDDIGVSTYIADNLPNGVLGYHCALITPDENLLTGKYLNVVLHTPYAQKYFELNASGSGQRYTLTVDIIAGFPVPVPDIKTQHIVGDFFSAIDKKLSTNNRINTELESMAKTIYDYWFTQFDFPDENGKPYKSSGGKMVWNEELKREIPEEWERVLLKDIENNIVTGKTPSTKCPEYYNGDIPFITIGDIRGNTYIVSTEQKLSKTGADTQLKKYIPNNSLCVSCIASPGLIGFATTDSQTNQQINSIIFSNENNKFFLYFALNDFFSNSRGAKTGNTFDNMNKEEFSNIIMIYSSDIVSLFHKKVEPIFNMIRKNSVENQQLASLRDWLLPMLMNGQVRFKVVE